MCIIFFNFNITAFFFFDFLWFIYQKCKQQLRNVKFQGRIQDFKLGGGGGALNNIAPSGGRRDNIWVFRVKNHDFTPKNNIFFQF